MRNVAEKLYKIIVNSKPSIEGWSVTKIHESLANPHVHYLKAENSGKLVGFLLYQKVLDEAEVLLIFVDSKNRRQGIGTQLCEQLIHHVRKQQVTEVFLEVRISNHMAQQLYEKVGFMAVHIRKNYYHDPKEDALLMKYTIKLEE